MTLILEYAFTFTHNVCALFGTTLNIYLMFLAWFKSPKSMKTYTILILNFAVMDLMGCLLDFLTEDRVIPGKETIAYVSFGPCRYAGPYLCWVLFGLLLTCLTHSLFSLCYSFYYRYRILHADHPDAKRVLLSLSVIMIPSPLQTYGYIVSYDDPEVVRRKIAIQFPQYNLTGQTISGFRDLTDFRAWIPILNCVVPIAPIYGGIFFFRYKILHLLKEKSSMMSSETRNVHSQLLKILTYQAIIPVCMLLGMGLFALSMFDIHHHEDQEYCTMVFNVLLPVLSPVVYILCLTPYRRFTYRLFKKVTGNKVGAVAKISTRNGQSSGTNPANTITKN